MKCGALITMEDMKELENEGSQLTLDLTCVNGCSYRRQSQPTVSDVESQKVADFKVMSCTQVSSSNAMEIRGFKEALKSREENGVKISTISTDRHPQIVKEMRLKEKWVSVIHHVTNRHDWPGNRHYHRCAHEPLDEQSERRKLWLSPESEAHKALVRTVKDKRLLKDLDHLTKCIHTTTLEVLVHSKIQVSVIN
ncbi:hypothetical protein DPX16_4281 [Anabarilius grahami]|uniref:Uncharacterized protein n=1 Tax=Anabarilius grahami TaxID=495550 RepID=A0A3N0Y358_ANAGA|nr:hypothetical protein DPX16_4281 [Anabarilius grahami]